MGLYPPDDPFVFRIALPLIVPVLILGGFAGAAAWSWLLQSYAALRQVLVPVWKQIGVGAVVVVAVAALALRLVSGVLIGTGRIPPDDPLLLVSALPLAVRWYGLIIVSGALVGTWLAAQRAERRGFNPELVWNQLMLGLVAGIVGARIYYVVFEWQQFQGDPLAMINIMAGGLAIHGAIIGALLACVFYTHRRSLPFWAWIDLFVPGFLLAQAIGRWGNFFNQEAYGEPTTLGFGVIIDAAHRLPVYGDMLLYPPDTLFHATFLYESVWNVVGVVLLLLLDRWFGTHQPTVRRWLRHGDVLFLYCIYYSSGRFWIEGLRTDSLYLGPLRIAQVISLTLVLAGGVALFINHRRTEE